MAQIENLTEYNEEVRRQAYQELLDYVEELRAGSVTDTAAGTFVACSLLIRGYMERKNLDGNES